MTTYTKRVFSGSTNGKGTKITQTSTPGDLIHTAVTGTTDFDEIWLYAYNHHTSAVVITLEFGGVTVPDNIIKVTIPSQPGLVPILPGLILQNGLLLRAFAADANLVTLYGWVNRIAL